MNLQVPYNFSSGLRLRASDPLIWDQIRLGPLEIPLKGPLQIPLKEPGTLSPKGLRTGFELQFEEAQELKRSPGLGLRTSGLRFWGCVFKILGLGPRAKGLRFRA